MSRFRFNTAYIGNLGVECEAFVTDSHGTIVAKADEVLVALRNTELAQDFCPELSACQIEWKTKPLVLAELPDAVQQHQRILYEAASACNLGIRYSELAPETMPLTVYPDERYIAIAKQLNPAVLSAGCRVAGVHIHVGMPDHETALRVYNHVVRFMYELMQMGDASNGGRLNLYRAMAPAWKPPQFASWSEMYAYACKHNWDGDPKSWWSLIRISQHGTIEFRTFGSTASVSKILAWAKFCYVLCQQKTKNA